MANCYFRNTGNQSWNIASNWSSSDGGGSRNGVPVIGDIALFTANSGDCVIDTIVNPVSGLNTTGYIGTLTMLSTLGVSGTVIIGTGTIIDNSSSAPLDIRGAISITTNGVIIPYISVSSTSTITLNDVVNISGSMSLGADTTWLGTAGFLVNNVTSPNVSNMVLKAGIVYKIRGRFTMLAKDNVHKSIVSGTAGTKVMLVVGGPINLGCIDFTDIDASAGRAVYTYNGVVTNCVNVNTMVDKIPVVNSTAAGSMML